MTKNIDLPAAERMWFVSKQRGFTDDVEMAAHDGKGIPIPAPGYVASYVRRVERDCERKLKQQKKPIKDLWEALLDAIEQEEAIHEKQGDPEEYRSACGQTFGISLAIAIVSFHEEWKADPDGTQEKVMNIAKSMFEDE